MSRFIFPILIGFVLCFSLSAHAGTTSTIQLSKKAVCTIYANTFMRESATANSDGSSTSTCLSGIPSEYKSFYDQFLAQCLAATASDMQQYQQQYKSSPCKVPMPKVQ
jgi:hypothetical protein